MRRSGEWRPGCSSQRMDRNVSNGSGNGIWLRRRRSASRLARSIADYVYDTYGTNNICEDDFDEEEFTGVLMEAATECM